MLFKIFGTFPSNLSNLKALPQSLFIVQPTFIKVREFWEVTFSVENANEEFTKKAVVLSNSKF